MENGQMVGTASTTGRGTTADATQPRARVAPRLDVYENGEEIVVVMDLPGVALDQVRIDLEGGQLKLTAESSLGPSPGAKPLAEEFPPRSYLQSFKVPEGVDTEHVTATLVDGVLQLHLPKAAGHAQRRIEVKSA